MDENNPKKTFILEDLDEEENPTPSKPLKAGDVCPKCGKGKLDYDGTLSLTCPVCGYKETGCFT
ncbi:MAG: hypothetical protein ACPL3P_04170 [Anaerolineales bacterium]